jgi:hypothetical protein
MATLNKFMWNGIKVNGKLCPSSYSWCDAWDMPSQKCGELPRNIPAHLTIYAREYSGFPAEVRAEFDVQNDSDGQTDYFEHDRIRVLPTHPRFAEIKAAMDLEAEHDAKMQAKRTVRGETKRLASMEAHLENLRRLILVSEQDAFLSPTPERKNKVANYKRCEVALLADIEKTKAVIETAKARAS